MDTRDLMHALVKERGKAVLALLGDLLGRLFTLSQEGAHRSQRQE